MRKTTEISTKNGEFGNQTTGGTVNGCQKQIGEKKLVRKMLSFVVYLFFVLFRWAFENRYSDRDIVPAPTKI